MKNVEVPKKKPRCQFISKTGSRCHADPQTGKDWCFFHDPEQKKKQAEARRQGGEARICQTEPAITLPPNLPVMPLEKFSDVLSLLEETVNHLLHGEMDVPAARALGYLSGLLQRALKADVQPIAARLADTINMFRRGEMDLRTAKTIGHLSSLMLNALKQQAQQQRAAATMEGARASEATRLAQAIPAQAVPRDIGALAAPILTVKPPNDHAPHRPQ